MFTRFAHWLRRCAFKVPYSSVPVLLLNVQDKSYTIAVLPLRQLAAVSMVDLLFCFSSRIFHPIAGRLRGSYFSWWNFQILSPAGCRQGCGGKLLFFLLVFGSGRALVGWYACKARLGLVLASQAKVHYEFACVMFWRFFLEISTKKYFTSCDPHRDIYTFCYWQIFWHSIWHIFWHSIWRIFWHSIWQIFWHSIWQIFWHSIWQTFWHFIWHTLWHFIWHSIWHIFWHSIWHIFWHIIWQIFWHSIWQTFWHFIWHIFWHSIWHFIWHSIWHTFWHSIWHIFEHSICHIFWHIIWQILWNFIWHIFWHSIWPLRSSGAHWAGQVPGWGWGPAVHTELGRSQVEVQRCTLSWEGPRLRSSSAHWRNCWRRRRRRRRRRTKRRRRRRRRRTRRRTTALIKSNNPHLAGGEIHVDCARDVSLIAATFYDLRNSLAPAVNHCKKKCSWCDFSGVMCRVFFTAPATQDVPLMWVKSTPQ